MPQSRSPGSFHPRFSTWLASPSQLERTLAGNHEILRDFLARLRAVEQGSPANHLLLVGPRGIGKTHLLCLGGHYVAGRAQKPNDWLGPSSAWICVLFAEEEYAGQNSLANFLLTFCAKLQEELPLEGLWRLPTTLHQEIDQHIVDCCFERLERFYGEKGQRILLVVDNLQRVLRQWSDDDQQKLRAFLSRNNLLVILSSAASVFREVSDHKAAFYDFFEVRLLSELTNEQVLDLLSRRFREEGRQAEYNARKEELAKKIPAIAVLTGGNPRLVLFLYDIATRSTFLDVELALRYLLEELREYFVSRFDRLPDQARKVLDTIAQMPGPATPKDIAREARLQAALVNAQLKRLKEGHYVRPIKFQRRKSTRYDVTERLCRIWRQTATVAGRQRFQFLTDFLKLYFTPEEARGLYSEHLEFLHAPRALPREEVIRHIEELYYFQAAGEGEIRHGAFSSRVESRVRLGELQWAEQEAQHFAAESMRNEDKVGVTPASNAQAMIHLESGRYLDAAADVQRLVEVGAYEDAVAVAERLVAASPDSREAWMSLGRAALAQGDYGQALAAFRKAADVDRPTSALLCCQAIALNLLDRPEEALKCAEQAVTMDERDVIAWEQLGFAAGNMGHHERALAAFRKAAEVDRPTSARLCYQAVALNALKRWDEALTCAEQAVAMDEKNARAWEELGVTAGVMGYHDRALAAFRKTAEAGGSSGRLREMEATLLRHLGRAQESLSVLDQALALEADNPHLWRAKAWTLLELDQFEQALECLEQARQKGATLRMYHHDRGDLLLLGGRYAEALKDLEEGLRAEPGDWDLQGDRLIALGCLGQQGPLMEALPATLAKVRVPATSSPSVCQYAYDVALNALRRGEKGICLGLLCASLEMEPWTSSDWFGKQLGNFLRRALEAQPQAFIGLVQVLSERLKDEKALKLLEPFFAASEFLQTRNLAILERLFPEVRELVLDIVKRVEPALYEQSKRLI